MEKAEAPSPWSALLPGGLSGAALSNSGQRVTAPRLLVHRHVRRASGHLTPERVHADLEAELPSLSPATVYTTLELLAQLGFTRRVATPRGMTVYDPRVEPHHHAICSGCGRIVDLDAPVPMHRASGAARAAGFRVDTAAVLVSGLCAMCAAADG